MRNIGVQPRHNKLTPKKQKNKERRVPANYYQCAHYPPSSDSASPVGRCLSCNEIQSASGKQWPFSSLRVPDASDQLNSVWSVRCRGGSANAMLRVGTSGKSFFHAAARWRFSKIRQQTMLCATRVNEAVTPVYSRYAEREVSIWIETPKVVGALLTGASTRTRIVKRVKAKFSRLAWKSQKCEGSYQTAQERRQCLTVVSSMLSYLEDANLISDSLSRYNTLSSGVPELTEVRRLSLMIKRV